METVQEVRYSGVVVGRGVPVREREAGGAFVVLAEPLPVGTKITLRGEGGDETGRVTEVIESANPDQAGMRIEFVVAGETGARAPQAKPIEAKPAETKPVENPPELPPAAAAEIPPVTAAPAARATPTPPAAPEPPQAASGLAAGSPPAPVAAEAAPGHVPDSDSTASTSVPAASTDPATGGSGKRRRRRR